MMIFTETCRGGRQVGLGSQVHVETHIYHLLVHRWQVDSDKEQPNVRWGCLCVSLSLRASGGWTTQNWSFFLLISVLLVFFCWVEKLLQFRIGGERVRISWVQRISRPIFRMCFFECTKYLWYSSIWAILSLCFLFFGPFASMTRCQSMENVHPLLGSSGLQHFSCLPFYPPLPGEKIHFD